MLLSAEHLVCARADCALFAPLSFTLHAGSCLYVHGANGSGKTTLLRTLAGICPAYAGTLTIKEDAEVFYLGHRDGLYAELTPHEHLKLFKSLYGREKSVGLEAVGLELQAHMEVRRLSAGQKRRLALLRLFLSAAPLWLLDEPFANLDVDGSAVLAALLKIHMEAGGGVVMARHGIFQSDEAERITLQKAAA